MLIEGFDFSELLFKLTIFIFFIIFIYTLYKRYVLPYFYNEILSIRKKDNDLIEQQNLLNLSKESLTQQIADQEKTFSVLEKKVDEWNQFFIKQEEKIENENKNLLEKINQKRQKQQANLTLYKTDKIVIPQAVKFSYKEIGDLYGGDAGWGLLKELVLKIQPDKD